MAGPLRGGGVNGRDIKEKTFNLFLQRSKISRAIKLEGKKDFFCGFPIGKTHKNIIVF